MTRAALALLLPLLAVAAPVPKSAPTLADVYGTATDPKSKTKCELTKSGGLTVTVPKDAAVEGLTVPPTLGRVVEGDFVVTVKVTHAVDKTARKPTGNNRACAVAAAGIALHPEGDATTRVTVTRDHSYDVQEWYTHLSVQADLGSFGSGGTTKQGAKLDEEPVHLRVTRRGQIVTAEKSADGKTWEEIGVQPFPQLKAKTKVTVGPVAFHSTDAECTATFEEYKIEPLKDEKK